MLKLAPPRLSLVPLLLLASTLARADSLDLGKRLYHQFDYDGARVALLRATGYADEGRRAEAYLYLGLVATVAADDEDALQAFRTALTLRAELRLPAGTSPKVVQIFERARADLLRELRRGQAAAPRAPRQAPRAVSAAPWAAAPPIGPPSIAEAVKPPPSRVSRWVAAGLAVGAVAAGGAGLFEGAAAKTSAAGAYQTDYFQSDSLRDQALAQGRARTANELFAGAALLALAGLGVFLVW